MGQWVVVIEGTGPHDNGKKEDVDIIATVAVQALRDAGHIGVRSMLYLGSGRAIVTVPKTIPE